MSNTLFIWLKCRAQLKWGRQRRVWLMPGINPVFSVIFSKHRPRTPLICCSLKTGPTHLSSFDPSISVKAQQQKKKKKRRRTHTCDWPAGERLVFQLAVIRDWLQEEHVLIAFFERAVRFCGRETKSHVKNKTKQNKKRWKGWKSRVTFSSVGRGRGEPFRSWRTEEKKRKTNRCLEAVLKLSKSLIFLSFFFFALLRRYRDIDKGIPDLFSSHLLLQACSVDGDSGRAL